MKVTDMPTRTGFAVEVTTVDVAAGFTVSVSAADELPKLRSPLYEAVIECEPAAKLVTESCAILFDTLAVPSELLPSKNVTVPLARSPLKDGTTVAVNVTA